MDLMDELTRMADLVSEHAAGSMVASEKKIEQWQKLFAYSRDEAIVKISQRNEDFINRKTVSDEIWEEVKTEWAAKGYDKDAYEHWLEIKLQAPKQNQKQSSYAEKDSSIQYLMRLEGQISSPEQLQALLGTDRLPEVKHDLEDSTVRFCYVSLPERQFLESKIIPTPTFISLGTPPSVKCLDANSKYPTLGIDCTLPQYRASSDTERFEPSQDQYPVWYFFYGNLAKPEILSPRLGIPEHEIHYTPAKVWGGRLGTWKNKYRALLDGTPEQFVEGYGFLVQSKEIEDWLRAYETAAYEVVRCSMELEGGKIVPACVFRFCNGDSV